MVSGQSTALYSRAEVLKRQEAAAHPDPPSCPLPGFPPSSQVTDLRGGQCGVVQGAKEWLGLGVWIRDKPGPYLPAASARVCLQPLSPPQHSSACTVLIHLLNSEASSGWLSKSGHLEQQNASEPHRADSCAFKAPLVLMASSTPHFLITFHVQPRCNVNINSSSLEWGLPK